MFAHGVGCPAFRASRCNSPISMTSRTVRFRPKRICHPVWAHLLGLEARILRRDYLRGRSQNDGSARSLLQSEHKIASGLCSVLLAIEYTSPHLYPFRQPELSAKTFFHDSTHIFIPSILTRNSIVAFRKLGLATVD